MLDSVQSAVLMKKTLPLLIALVLGAGAARALDPHVEAVLRTVEGARGKVEKTADGQSLKLVDPAVPAAALKFE